MSLICSYCSADVNDIHDGNKDDKRIIADMTEETDEMGSVKRTGRKRVRSPTVSSDEDDGWASHQLKKVMKLRD